ncbi:hypothetical protein TREMEDRAFT_61080 [Tremella mesenterica DSM 1558]|nr:uncharacterized protein TREMEDRAFT_61080 [Tremella mesenterica DSM 1558]EIW70576.1 hypothetical protein TREMEDRAFT_61080 [Tremella mesenterica DSM 1558]
MKRFRLVDNPNKTQDSHISNSYDKLSHSHKSQHSRPCSLDEKRYSTTSSRSLRPTISSKECQSSRFLSTQSRSLETLSSTRSRPSETLSSTRSRPSSTQSRPSTSSSTRYQDCPSPQPTSHQGIPNEYSHHSITDNQTYDTSINSKPTYRTGKHRNISGISVAHKLNRSYEPLDIMEKRGSVMSSRKRVDQVDPRNCSKRMTPTSNSLEKWYDQTTPSTRSSTSSTHMTPCSSRLSSTVMTPSTTQSGYRYDRSSSRRSSRPASSTSGLSRSGAMRKSTSSFSGCADSSLVMSRMMCDPSSTTWDKSSSSKVIVPVDKRDRGIHDRSIHHSTQSRDPRWMEKVVEGYQKFSKENREDFGICHVRDTREMRESENERNGRWASHQRQAESDLETGVETNKVGYDLQWEPDTDPDAVGYDPAVEVWKKLEGLVGRKPSVRERGRWVVRPSRSMKQEVTESPESGFHRETDEESVGVGEQRDDISSSRASSASGMKVLSAVDDLPVVRMVSSRRTGGLIPGESEEERRSGRKVVGGESVGMIEKKGERIEEDSYIESFSISDYCENTDTEVIFDMTAPLVSSLSAVASTPANTPCLHRESLQRVNKVMKRRDEKIKEGIIDEISFATSISPLSVIQAQNTPLPLIPSVFSAASSPLTSMTPPNDRGMSSTRLKHNPECLQAPITETNEGEIGKKVLSEKKSLRRKAWNMFKLDSPIIKALRRLDHDSTPDLDQALRAVDNRKIISSRSSVSQGGSDKPPNLGLGLGMNMSSKSTYSLPVIEPRWLRFLKGKEDEELVQVTDLDTGEKHELGLKELEQRGSFRRR